MPASTTIQQGTYLLLKAGGTTVGGATTSTLKVSAEAIPVIHKGGGNWERTLAGVRDWSVDFDAIPLESGSEVSGRNLSVTVSTVALKGIESARIALTSDVAETANTTSGFVKDRIGTTRRAEITLSGAYYDPRGTGATALSTTLGEIMGTTSAGLSVVVSFGTALSITGTYRPVGVDISTPVAEIIKSGITWRSTGAVTYTMTNLDAGVAGLLTAFITTARAAPITALLVSADSGATQWTGSTLPTALTFDVPYERAAGVSGTLVGVGALTEGATI